MNCAAGWDREGRNMDVARIVVKPAEGRAVSLGGMGVVFKIRRADTGGAFAGVEHPIEPGRLVMPHVHLDEDEYSYVLEGTIGARVADHEIVAGRGSHVIKPRGLMHTSRNAGPGPARPLEVIAPAGFETSFAELAEAGDGPAVGASGGEATRSLTGELRSNKRNPEPD